MRKIIFVTMAVALNICMPAFCEEITIPKGFALGFGLGEQAGDGSLSFNMTSPYFHFKFDPNIRNWAAIRIGGDFRLKEAVPIGGTNDTMVTYYTARVGYVGGIEVSNWMRMYAEIGGMSVFPTTALASSTNPHFGAYGHIGSEIFLGRNIFTKNTGIYFEIGQEVCSAKSKFDKLINHPLVGWGPTACAGGRFYL